MRGGILDQSVEFDVMRVSGGGREGERVKRNKDKGEKVSEVRVNKTKKEMQ